MDVWRGIRFLTPYLLKYKKLFIVIFVAMTLVAATSALTAYIFKHILNDIFIAKDELMLAVLPLIVIALFMTRGISRFISSYLTSKIGVSVANELRDTVFSHLGKAEFSSVRNITTGDINAILIQTVLNIQNTVAKTIPQLIISSLTILALIIVIVYADWRLSIFAVAVGALMIIPVRLLGKGVKRHTDSSEDMVSQMSNRINETFNNFDLVKVYNREDHERLLFSNFLQRYKNYQIKLAKYQLLASPFMEFFIAVSIAIVIYAGGHFVIDGSMSAGDFFAFMVALMMLYAPIKNLTQNYMALFALNGYVERIEKVLDLPLESSRGKSEELDRIDNIVFDEVNYSIDDTQILSDISFEIEDGDRVAIVGKSGAGKSSIISLLFGFGKYSKGVIRINGIDQNEYSLHAIRQQISYVNQNAGVFNISLQDNILYGETMDTKRYKEAVHRAECGFIYDSIGGDQELAGEFGNSLSGGQRQRIALARAIYKNGSLFILDEATSALDTNTESMIQESLEQVMSEKTSIVIAHRLTTIATCNKVLVLEQGRVVAYGRYDEVSRSEAFRRNFGMASIDD